MKGIIRIEEYLKDTQQIIVRFCKFYDNESIENYPEIVIDLANLDTQNYDYFIESLMRIGTDIISNHEKSKPIVNKVDDIDMVDLDIESLVGKNIGAKLENYRRSSLKMRKIEL